MIAAPLSSDVIRRYTEGGCFTLAKRLHQLRGWPVLVLDDIHAGVLLDEVTVLDVEGIWTREEWMRKWSIFCTASSVGPVELIEVYEDWKAPTSKRDIERESDSPLIAEMLEAFADFASRPAFVTVSDGQVK